MKIKEIPKHERPRERLIQYGPKGLSNSELLAVILQTGSIGMNAVDTAQSILKKYSLQEMARCSMRELCQVRGVGLSKAARILAMAELTTRSLRQDTTRISIRSADDVYQYVKPIIGEELQEHFIVLCLDTKHRVISHHISSIGTLNTTVIHPREIFSRAIRESAHAIIVAHNHPSGDVEPSDEDVQVTKELIKAGHILGIQMLDHVIVGQGFWSYNSERHNILQSCPDN